MKWAYETATCYCCGGPSEVNGSAFERHICSVCMEEVEERAALIIWNKWKSECPGNRAKAESLVESIVEEVRQAYGEEEEVYDVH